MVWRLWLGISARLDRSVVRDEVIIYINGVVWRV
jgi:hypothetical protein